MTADLVNGRCGWCGTDALYVAYHDREWGRLAPGDERRLFELLVLESAQAGLSWITILRKREGYRRAFCGFDAARVARLTEADVTRLMHCEGIVRNRRKIVATINNARCFLAVRREWGTFHAYVCSFLPSAPPICNRPKTLGDIPAATPLSDALSKDMKRRGFKFFGPTICYAFLQSAGYVNDHLEGCCCAPGCSR